MDELESQSLKYVNLFSSRILDKCSIEIQIIVFCKIYVVAPLNIHAELSV